MYKIAIVEDEHESAESLMKCLDEYAAQNGVQFSVTHFKSGLDFLDEYSFDFDVVFMDIDMPKMNGLKTAQELRKIDQSVLLVFITFLAKYAIKGYEVDAVDYIIKPLNYDAFRLKLDRVLSRCKKYESHEIILSTSDGNIRVKISDLDYVEVNDHQILYHTANGVFRAYGSMKPLLKQFPSEQFYLCNRCYLVNLRNVSRIEGSSVIVGGDKLLISRPRRKGFIDALHRYSLNRVSDTWGGGGGKP